MALLWVVVAKSGTNEIDDGDFILHAIICIHTRGVGIGESHDEFRHAVWNGCASWLLPGRLPSVVFRGGGGR